MFVHCFVLATVLFAYDVIGEKMDYTMSKFKAAVFNHEWILPPDSQIAVNRTQAVTNMMRNIDVYRDVTPQAKNRGAHIIVFPEDGIFGFTFSRETILPYLETIPDPFEVSWCPCDDPDKYENVEIQVALSCLAKNHNIYLVANMGDVQPCQRSKDPKCPADKRYQYNTDVAFGPDGTLLARYHKTHLFFENQFNKPEAEQIWFDTPFGRVGLMTCFDVLFEKPAVELVLESNVTIMAFPTAWFDELPLLPAIGFHSAFARALGINFLSANIHDPIKGIHGSGLYTPDGAQFFYYDGFPSSIPTLLVSELDVMAMPRPNIKVSENVQHLVDIAPFDENLEKDGGEQFKSDVVYYKTFDFKALEKSFGNVTICQKDVCCHLQYEMADGDFGKELFAFGAYDGQQRGEETFYVQICTLIKCAQQSNKYSCGSAVNSTLTSFKKIEILASAQTRFLFPSLIVSDGIGNLSLTRKDAWTFDNNRLWTSDNFQETVLSATLYGRDYNRDGAVGKRGAAAMLIVNHVFVALVNFCLLTFFHVDVE